MTGVKGWRNAGKRMENKWKIGENVMNLVISTFVHGKFPGLNELEKAARTNKYIAAKLKKHWTKKVADKMIGYGSLDEIFLHLTWYEDTKKRDPDNIAAAKKYVFDGLVLAKIIPNDGWKQINGWIDTFVHGKGQGVRIDIYEGYDEKLFVNLLA